MKTRYAMVALLLCAATLLLSGCDQHSEARGPAGSLRPDEGLRRKYEVFQTYQKTPLWSIRTKGTAVAICEVLGRYQATSALVSSLPKDHESDTLAALHPNMTFGDLEALRGQEAVEFMTDAVVFAKERLPVAECKEPAVAYTPIWALEEAMDALQATHSNPSEAKTSAEEIHSLVLANNLDELNRDLETRLASTTDDAESFRSLFLKRCDRWGITPEQLGAHPAARKLLANHLAECRECDK